MNLRKCRLRLRILVVCMLGHHCSLDGMRCLPQVNQRLWANSQPHCKCMVGRREKSESQSEISTLLEEKPGMSTGKRTKGCSCDSLPKGPGGLHREANHQLVHQALMALYMPTMSSLHSLVSPDTFCRENQTSLKIQRKCHLCDVLFKQKIISSLGCECSLIVVYHIHLCILSSFGIWQMLE